MVDGTSYEPATHEMVERSGITDEYAVNRMFELTLVGQTASNEYAMLDAVIRERLLKAYDDGHLEEAPASRTAD